MALLDSEIQRLRYELGYNLLSVGAEPYISYVAIFNQVVQVYLNAGAKTTSSTAVTAVALGGSPTPATITLASATGFASGQTVVLDVDSRQEIAMIESLSGSSATMLLSLAHAGTYPVAVEGSGESIVRELLVKLRNVSDKLTDAASTAGLKKVDEIEWYGGKQAGISVFEALKEQRSDWRRELASVVGVQNMWDVKGTSGGYELY